MDLIQFFLAVIQLHAVFPFSETSGQRTPQHNADVDGVAFSPHQYWVGKDVIFDKKPDTVALIEAANRLGLRIIKEQDHYHIQPATWRPG